jgi:TolB protein
VKIHLAQGRGREEKKMNIRIVSRLPRIPSGKIIRLAFCVVLALLLAGGAALMSGVGTARAAFPGENGKIAFIRESGSDAHIFTIKPDGSGLTKIYTTPRHDESLAWSADGQKLAFDGLRNGNWDIYTIYADGSHLKRITTSSAGDFSPSWSPNGERIAFMRQRGERGPNTFCQSCIYTIKVDGTGSKRLTGHRGFTSDPAWSPNGKKIAFSNGNIYKMNSADGTNKRNLTKTSQIYENEPNWSPDGRKIAYSTQNPNTGNENVRTMNADGTNQKNRTGRAGGWAPVWSPDGTKIAFLRGYHIYKMNPNGTGVRKLTSQYSDFPDWQPLP